MNQDNIMRAATLVREARSVVALTGAGISRPSGIPDFRSDGGLWQDHDPFEVASLRSFQHDPRRFYSWFSGLLEMLLAAHPNPAHLALTQLQHAKKLDAIVTQNIDGLHHRAGSHEVYEMHGHTRSATCMECGAQVSLEPLLGEIRRHHVPHCSCGGPYKPDVVLFDEMLPRGTFWLAQRAIERCDLLLIAGTSLEVYPVSDMPQMALRNKAKLVIVNLDTTYIDEHAEIVLHEDVAVALPAIAEMALG